MYSSWSEVPFKEKTEWAEWAIAHDKREQTEEEKLAWVNDHVAANAPIRDPFAEGVLLPRSAKSEAARMRSRRYQIQKKLRECFQIYELFAPEEAARRTGVQMEIMKAYLNYESQLPSSQIAEGPNGTFKLLTGFELGVDRGA